MNRLADYLSLHLLRRIDLRQRLAAAFVLLALLPLAIAGYLACAETTRAATARTRLYASEVLRQVAANIQLEMARMESDSEAMVLSDRVQAALTQYAGDKQMERSAARSDLTRVLLERYGAFDFINQKYFLDQDNKIMDTQVFSTLGRGVVRFVAHAPKLRGRPYWGVYDNGIGQNSLVLLRAIYNKSSNRLVGNLFIGVQPSHFAAIFEEVNLGSGGGLLMLDGQHGTPLAKAPASAADPMVEPALAADIKRSLLRNQASGSALYPAKGAQGGYLALYAQVAGTSWFVVGTIPLETLAADTQALREQLVLVGLACLAAALALALLVARSIARPLDALAHGMHATGTGDTAARVQAEGEDELTALAQAFNQMAGRVDRQHRLLEQRASEHTRELAAANGKLAVLSMTDGLTGIANRRRFDDALAAELQRATRAHSPLALVMLDLDFFRNYNELYGHQQGDACLRRLARLLESHTRRAGDLAARYGGEEFALIAADTDSQAALALADKLRAGFEALQLPHEGSPLGCITISIGAAVVVPDEALTPALLARLAEQAVQRAKEQGRNQVVLADRRVEL